MTAVSYSWNTIQVLEYLFKFISHSYTLYRRGRSSEDETVKDSIKSFFVDVTQIMKAPRMEEKIYGKTQNLQVGCSGSLNGSRIMVCARPI